jgi:hypothetical protein
MTVSFDQARAIADAVLLEGYLLYPYRASAQKNQVMRFQFGVLTPRPVAEAGTGETWFSQTECLLEADDEEMAVPDGFQLRVRFLQLQMRTVEDPAGVPVENLEVAGNPIPPWDEGVERAVDLTASVGELLGGRTLDFTIPGGEDVEEVRATDGSLVGRVRRRRQELTGVVRLAAERFGGPYPLLKLRVRVENHTPWADPSVPREAAMRGSLLATHSLLGASVGKFVSLLDPPWWATPAVEECQNLHTWPVLVGADRTDVMLSSPIILYDNPQIAPESAGELFDGLENDEILTLRTMTLTDEEKRQARGTDPRAAALLDRVDGLPPEILERLHGAIRELRTVAPDVGDAEPLPWWEPGAEAPVSPETDTIRIGDLAVGRGWRVGLRPGAKRADAQDMFLLGRIGVVDHVRHDVEGQSYLAVTLEDDENADLHAATGRFLYFSAAEVDPIEGPAGSGGTPTGRLPEIDWPEIRELPS